MTLCILFLYIVNASPSLFACVIICVLCFWISWYCIWIWIYFRSCQDIDECEQFKDRILCVGECVNQPGSYSCQCPEGYRIGSDGRTCQGERIIIIVNFNCDFYVQYYTLCQQIKIKGVFFFVSCSNVHEYDMKGYDIIYELITRLHYCC